MYSERAFYDMLFLIVEGRYRLKRQPELNEEEVIRDLCRTLDIPCDEKILEATRPQVTESCDIWFISKKNREAWLRYCQICEKKSAH